MARARDAVAMPITNKMGVPHLHIHLSRPHEAAELKRMVEAMHGRGVGGTPEPVFNPAVSTAQRKLFAMAEHHPDALFARDRRLARLPHATLHEFAATRGLPSTPHRRRS